MTDLIRIQKVDEVFNMVIPSDRGIGAELEAYFTFTVPGAQFMPSVRNKIWDGKIRLYNTMTQYLYAGLMPYVERFATERDYEVEYTYDTAYKNFSLVEAEEFIKKQEFSMEPRDYQIKAFVDAIRGRRHVFVSPTASGKSFIIYIIMRYYLAPTLIIVPTTSLVHQMYGDFKDYGFNSDKYAHKIFSGQEKDVDKPVIITTWQSVYKMPKKWFERFDVVFGDEAHLFKAQSLTKIMTKLTDCRYRYGFTGTLDGTKTHKLILEGLFGPVKQVTTTKTLMDKKHLADFSIKILVLSYEDSERKLVSRMNYQDEMNFLVSHVKRNNYIKNLALSLNGNTLLLFQYVENHGKILYNMIDSESKGRKVFFVHGGVDGFEREDIRKIVENENNAIIVASYGTFSTGINIKNLHNVIFASPSKSRIRNLQSIGRSLRMSEQKTNAVLYDIADDLSWKSKKNYTIQHLEERIKIYDGEEFNYKPYRIGI